jgi:hypothetical protein
MTHNFYVYVHLRPDNTPFYIGKGSGNRITDISSRSKWWWNIVNKDYLVEKFPKYIKLAENLTEEESLNIEKEYIAKFGRKNIHENGLLINNTNGGEGTSGAILSQETRAKMSTSRIGDKNPMWNKPRPDYVKQAVSRANKGRPNVWKGKERPDDSKLKMSIAQGGIPISFIHLPSGLIVENVINKAEFSRKYNLNGNHINAIVRGERSTHKGWTLYISKGK